MRKVLALVVKALGVIVGLLILGVGYVAYSFSTPLKTARVSSGRAGAFIIGETKEQALARLPNGVFSPQPKPIECPKNWIVVSNMSMTERTCLLSTDVWIDGTSSTKDVCPSRTDVNTELRFKGGKLSHVITECRRPK